MRSTLRVLPLLLCLIGSLVTAQVKIGTNPQNLNPTSILELEGENGVLVIPRMGDNLMQALTPLRGALVYNTDANCVYQYDGTQWNSLCSETVNESLAFEGGELVLTDSNGGVVSVPLDGAVQQSFTANPIVNFSETIIITQEGTNYNFEVGVINTDNIADGGVNGTDIQDASITTADIAPDAITSDLLSENAVDDNAIDYTVVTLSDFVNDAGFIQNEVDGDPTNELQTPILENTILYLSGTTLADGVNLQQFEESPAVNALAITLQNHINGDDISDRNEITTIQNNNDGTTTITNSDGDFVVVNSAPSTDQLLRQDQTNFNANNSRLTIGLERGGTVTADFTPLRNLITDNQQLNAQQTIFNPTTSVLTIALEDGGTVQEDLSALEETAAINQNTTLITNLRNEFDNLTANQIPSGFNPDQYTETAAHVDGHLEGIDNELAQIANDIDNLTAAGGSDGYIDNAILNGTNLELSGTGLAQATVNLAPLLTNLQDQIDNLNGTQITSTYNPTNYTQTAAHVDGHLQGIDAAFASVAADIAAVSAAGGADGNDFITGGNFTGSTLNLTGTGGAGASIDLNPLINNLDLTMNGAGLLFISSNPTPANLNLFYASDQELADAIQDSEALDLDKDDTNEIQNISSTDGSITITQTGNDFDLSIGTISGGPGGIISANSISAGDIGPNAVGPSEIQSEAVSSDEIENLSIINEDISATAAIEGTKINPDFGAQDVSTNGDFIEKGAQVVPDYVFQKYFTGYSILKSDYNFGSLKEIEEFIKTNHHLPGVTSAREANAKGYWNLSASNLQNLEKIEELFLYTIEQEKKIESLETKNQALEQQLQLLLQEVQNIKTTLSKKE